MKDKKEYYKEYEQKHREKRNARKRELYKQKCQKKIEEELANGIQFKSKKQRITLQQQLSQANEKYQKLKEWIKNQIEDLRHIDIKTKEQGLRINDAVNCFRQVLYKMEELEGEDEI